MTDVNKPTCGESGGRKADGSPCRGHLRLSPTNGLCIMHDPERADEATAMRSRGQKSTNATWNRLADGERPPLDIPKAPKTLADAVKISAWITHATLAKLIDARTSEAATKSCRQFQLCIEKRVLEEKVEALEAELKRLRRERRA